MRQLKVYKNQRGFTLLETLIVVAVITIMLSFGAGLVKPVWENARFRLFFTQLEADLYYAHSYAMSKKEVVIVQFPFYQNEYNAVVFSTKEVLFSRQVPKGFSYMTNLPSYQINPSGMVSKFGTLTFSHNDRKIKVTFFIGRGRFRVKE